MDINIGIQEQDRNEIAKGLSKLLAESYTLFLMTHNFHWNVTGPMFQALHTMFEEQYTELFTAVDEIAERMRALGVFAPGSFSEFKALSSLDIKEGVRDSNEMIKHLVNGHETVIRTAREAFPAAEKAGDESTCDLLTQRMQLHEKTAWMLRSLLA